MADIERNIIQRGVWATAPTRVDCGYGDINPTLDRYDHTRHLLHLILGCKRKLVQLIAIRIRSQLGGVKIAVIISA